MTHCCSQCSFKAQFESSLTMHRQLHHESGGDQTRVRLKTRASNISFAPRKDRPSSSYSEKNIYKRGKILRECINVKFRIVGDYVEWNLVVEMQNAKILKKMNLTNEGGRTARASKLELTTSSCNTAIALNDIRRETYGCHLCSFDADRITVLDRHLLNDHKIGLENLLKLVMAKTKDGLNNELINDEFGIRQPYYKPLNDIIEEGEFVIETRTPKIKILKHTGVNTDLKWNDIPDLKNNCRIIKKELEKLIESPAEEIHNDELLQKMQSLNECMCKFVDSTNTLKKVLTKGRSFDSKNSIRTDQSIDPAFNLGLGDQETPREWNRPHSEKLERHKSKYEEIRSEKKCSSDSYYF